MIKKVLKSCSPLPEYMDILSQDIQFLPGVGPNRKKILGEELGIYTYGDLLENYPYKHVDRSKI